MLCCEDLQALSNQCLAIDPFELRPHFKKFFKLFCTKFFPQIRIASNDFSLLGSFRDGVSHDIDFMTTRRQKFYKGFDPDL